MSSSLEPHHVPPARLPEEVDYYRPSHARELRAKAKRLERWMIGVGILMFGSILFWFVVIGPIMSRVDLESASRWALCGALPVPLAILLGVLATWAERLRKQAAALEAEHEARFGSLPEKVQ